MASRHREVPRTEENRDGGEGTRARTAVVLLHRCNPAHRRVMQGRQ